MCTFCPRRCAVDRGRGERGFCGAGARPTVALCQLHFAEEPPISGARGSGTVFFGGCNLRCVFCQNSAISRAPRGPEVSPSELAEAFLSLEREGAHNVNLVTPTPHVDSLAEAIGLARERGLSVPVIYNSGGYETVEGLRRLEGLVDVYLPDLKYRDDALALRYSGAPGYFAAATAAVLEMARQVGHPAYGAGGLITKGLLIRHLVLPGRRSDSIAVLRWIREALGEAAAVSLMAQYFPAGEAASFPEINRRVTSFEYGQVAGAMRSLGLTQGFVQSRAAAGDWVPRF